MTDPRDKSETANETPIGFAVDHEATPSSAGPASSGRDPDAHLSDAEFLGMILEDLPPHLELGVMLHLESCESCTLTLTAHYAACQQFDKRFPER